MVYNGYIWGNGDVEGLGCKVEHLNCIMVKKEKERKTFKKEEAFVYSL
jgi:hypothetical protein